MSDAKKGREDGHPLPNSEEAREDLVPEHLVREKGRGDDASEPSTPDEGFSDPAGARYPPSGTR